MITAPLLHGDVTAGVLKGLSSEPGSFGEADIQVLELLTDLLSSSISHATEHEAGRLFHLATHDQLTGLANRSLFYDRLRQQLNQAQRDSQQLAVIYLDMDRLKSTSDEYGHRAGNEAIMEFGHRLQSVSRQSDTVALLGR